jgi:hypothetical protein
VFVYDLNELLGPTERFTGEVSRRFLSVLHSNDICVCFSPEDLTHGPHWPAAQVRGVR